MERQNQNSSVISHAESLLVVSYDVHGYENEIETYLFDQNQVQKEKACELRETYEALHSMECNNREIHDDGNEIPFVQWVNEQGIWCQKVDQIRVEPIERGKNSEYNAFCLEHGA